MKRQGMRSLLMVGATPREPKIAELKKFPNGVRQVYDAPQPQGARLQAAARAAGIDKPEKSK
jgi:hypothetical protein